MQIPLDVSEDREFWSVWQSGPQFGTPLYYRPHLERFPERSAAVIAAVAHAGPGGVVVHCGGGGRDRAGQVSMRLLALAGVPAYVIAADYELSFERLPARYAARGEEDERGQPAGGTCDASRWASMVIVSGRIDNRPDRAGGADATCVEFLQWALPRLGLRWPGFRKVRRQVCRRVRQRVGALNLASLDAYRVYLDANPGEWAVLEALTSITISRFYRDRAVFAQLERVVLPVLATEAVAAERQRLMAWSAGCASGEEAYTLALMWSGALDARFPRLRLEVLATDIDAMMLQRTCEATYEASSLRELPAAWRERGFLLRGGRYVLRPEYRRLVTVRRHDLRARAPAGRFDLVLCRNAAFTYFALEHQRAVLHELTGVLRSGGALVIGVHEQLPSPPPYLERWPGTRAVFRRPLVAPVEGER